MGSADPDPDPSQEAESDSFQPQGLRSAGAGGRERNVRPSPEGVTSQAPREPVLHPESRREGGAFFPVLRFSDEEAEALSGPCGTLRAWARNWEPGKARVVPQLPQWVPPRAALTIEWELLAKLGPRVIDGACPHSRGLGVPHVEAGVRPRAVRVRGNPVPAHARSSPSSLWNDSVPSMSRHTVWSLWMPGCLCQGLGTDPARPLVGGRGKALSGPATNDLSLAPREPVHHHYNCNLLGSALPSARALAPAIYSWPLATEHPWGAGWAPRPSECLFIKQTSLQEDKPGAHREGA